MDVEEQEEQEVKEDVEKDVRMVGVGGSRGGMSMAKRWKRAYLEVQS